MVKTVRQNSLSRKFLVDGKNKSSLKVSKLLSSSTICL